MSFFSRLGALSCASSVGLGAVGAHALGTRPEEWQRIWTVSNRYQQFGSLALLSLPALKRSPRATLLGGACISLGTALFSGANYAVSYHENRAFWDDKGLKNPAPLGGGLMIVGFVALAVL